MIRWSKASILAMKRFVSSTDVDDPFRIRVARSDAERNAVCPSGIVPGGGAGRRAVADAGGGLVLVL